MRFHTVRSLAGLAFAAALMGGCQTPAEDVPPGGTTPPPDTGGGVPQDVKAIIFLQRVARNDGVGNVFDYTSYEPGGRLVKLEPPAANGKLTVLTSAPMFAQADIMSWDLSFDARSIVLSARIAGNDHYHVFLMGVDGSNPRQLTEG